MRIVGDMTRQSKMRPAFNTLHATTLDRWTTPDQLTQALRAADAVPDRHRLSEGAVYTAACRRYLMLTGEDWKATQQPEAATTWTTSDHRPRTRWAGQGWQWLCSCGAKGTGMHHSEPAALAAHNEHHAPAKC